MLTIQPKILTNYHPAFKSNNIEEDALENIDLFDMDEDTYEAQKEELEAQKEELEALKNDDKGFKTPKALKTALAGGAIITTGLLGGMASGWGTKKSIEGFEKLANTKQVKNLKLELKKINLETTEKAKTLKTKFLKSKLFTKISDAVKNGYKKFGETKIGKPIVEFLNSTGKLIKKGYNKVKEEFKNLWCKIKGVKSETYKKAAVNTVGVSGGIASGVNSFKEKEEKNGIKPVYTGGPLTKGKQPRVIDFTEEGDKV